MGHEKQFVNMFRRAIDMAQSKVALVIAGIIIFAVASRVLTVDEYSRLRLIFLPYEFVGPILSLGLPAAASYFLARTNDRGKVIRDLVAITVVSHLVFSILVVGYLYVVENTINITITLGLALSVYMICQGLVQICTSILADQGPVRAIKWSSIISVLVMGGTLLIFALSIKSHEAENFVVIRALGITAATAALIISILRTQSIRLARVITETSAKDYVRFSAPLGIASAVSAMSLATDKAIVAWLGSKNDYAIYVNGAMELPFVGIVAGSISAVLIGEMSKSVSRGNLVAARELFSKASEEGAKILFPVMIYALCLSKEIIVTLYSDKYTASANIFAVYLFFIPIRIVVFGSALVALGKSSVILTRAIIELVLNAILSVSLWKLAGIYGVAYASLLSAYVWTVPLNLRLISGGFQISFTKLFRYSKLLRVLLVSLIPAPVYLLAGGLNFVRPFVILLFCSIPLLCTLAYLRRFGGRLD